MEKLDYSAFAHALSQLQESLVYANSDLAKDAKLFAQFRNSAIQCFEYSYELAYKTLKRRLEFDSPSPTAIDSMDFRELLRTGSEAGLIKNPAAWFNYRTLRNKTSHGYDSRVADEVFTALPPFLIDAQALLAAIAARSE